MFEAITYRNMLKEKAHLLGIFLRKADVQHDCNIMY